ncbi:hypothetical protein K435DRAFT_774078 [Dendrothele bispora CBS 962.96]|uniref:Uncharacterized protein n=1 Tax=Dendrothele bispora (strain CBS 962.96) TaxID=1314807 RepID=A0A4S8MQ80_DENBC|nr:hypothetical protein K435DRAFT_774078 [Dendrothele bispora CBS 962.96]
MQRFKRVFSPKTSKKTGGSSRRRSKSFSSLPLSNAENVRNDSESLPESSEKRRPRIRPSDITLVIDIAPGKKVESEEDSSSATDEPATPRTPPLFINKDFLDNFPQPPQNHAYSASTARIPIFPTDYGIPADNLLPPLPPKVERYMQEQKSAVQTSASRQPLSRSSSSASYCRPTYSAYPSLRSQTPTDSSPVSRAPSRNGLVTRPVYHTSHPNCSTRSLGANVMLGSNGKTSLSDSPPLNHKKSASDFAAYNPPTVVQQSSPHHHRGRQQVFNRTDPRYRPGPRQRIPENVDEHGEVAYPSYHGTYAPRCTPPPAGSRNDSQSRSRAPGRVHQNPGYF